MSYPFGDGLSCTGGPDATEQHFTGKERDSESGLDYFRARYMTSDLGRFLTPDWAAAPTAVPYAAFGDPQSLNLYEYVGNNPNTGIDVDGHVGDNSGNITSLLNSGGAEDGYQWEVENAAAQNQSSGTSTSSTNPSGTTTNSGQQSGGPPAPSNPNPPIPDPYVAPGTSDTRNAVLGILSTQNSCSAFFDAAAATLPGANGATAAQIFSAVDIRLYVAPPTTGAVTQEGKGANGAIFVNKSGPFFNTFGTVNGKVQSLNVAPGYSGGFSATKTLIMLHELGHLVGALPVDGNNQALSNKNTETIIQNCSKEIGK